MLYQCDHIRLSSKDDLWWTPVSVWKWGVGRCQSLSSWGQSCRCYMPTWLTPVKTLDTWGQVCFPGQQHFTGVVTLLLRSLSASPHNLLGIPIWTLVPGFSWTSIQALFPFAYFNVYPVIAINLNYEYNSFLESCDSQSSSPRVVLGTTDTLSLKGSVCWHIQGF